MLERIVRIGQNKLFLLAVLVLYIFFVSLSYALQENFRYFDEGIVVQRSAVCFSKNVDDLKWRSVGGYNQVWQVAKLNCIPFRIYYAIRQADCEREEITDNFPCTNSYSSFVRGIFGGESFSEKGHISELSVLYRSVAASPLYFVSRGTAEERELGRLILIGRSLSVFMTCLAAAAFYFAACQLAAVPFAWLITCATFSRPEILRVSTLVAIPSLFYLHVGLVLLFLIRLKGSYRFRDVFCLMLTLFSLQFVGAYGPSLVLVAACAFLAGALTDMRKSIRPLDGMIIGPCVFILISFLFLHVKENVPVYSTLSHNFHAFQTLLQTPDVGVRIVAMVRELFSLFLSKALLITSPRASLFESGITIVLFFIGLYAACFQMRPSIQKRVLGWPILVFYLGSLLVTMLFSNKDWDWMLVPAPVLVRFAANAGALFIFFWLFQKITRTRPGTIPLECAPEIFASRLLKKIERKQN